jgi:hypothetical protein
VLAVAGLQTPAAAAPAFAMPPGASASGNLILAQACPRGYNAYRGRCVPARAYGGRSYGRSGRRLGGYDGYYGYYGCPPGTNPSPYSGRCVWSGGAACPPGYNALRGRCVPNW